MPGALFTFFPILYFHSQTFSTMYFALSFHFQSVLFITVLLAAVLHALPLETRAKPKRPSVLRGLGCNNSDRHGGVGPCVCGGQLHLNTPPDQPVTECGRNFAFKFTTNNNPIPVEYVTSFYSKEIMSSNPHDLGAHRHSLARKSGVGLRCALVYPHSSDLTHELTCYLGDR